MGEERSKSEAAQANGVIRRLFRWLRPLPINTICEQANVERAVLDATTEVMLRRQGKAAAIEYVCWKVSVSRSTAKAYVKALRKAQSKKALKQGP